MAWKLLEPPQTQYETQNSEKPTFLSGIGFDSAKQRRGVSVCNTTQKKEQTCKEITSEMCSKPLVIDFQRRLVYPLGILIIHESGTPFLTNQHYPQDPCMVYNANIWGILMVNVTIYSIHGAYGLWNESGILRTAQSHCMESRDLRSMSMSMNRQIYHVFGMAVPFIHIILK